MGGVGKGKGGGGWRGGCFALCLLFVFFFRLFFSFRLVLAFFIITCRLVVLSNDRFRSTFDDLDHEPAVTSTQLQSRSLGQRPAGCYMRISDTVSYTCRSRCLHVRRRLSILGVIVSPVPGYHRATNALLHARDMLVMCLLYS